MGLSLSFLLLYSTAALSFSDSDRFLSDVGGLEGRMPLNSALKFNYKLYPNMLIL